MFVAEDDKPTPEELEAGGLFGALDREAVQSLVDGAEVQCFDDGEVVFRENDGGRIMYLVLEGTVALSLADASIAAIGSGDWFGEMSLLDMMPRPVTATTTAPCRLLALRPTQLDALYRSDMKAYALVVMNLARQLSRRLRDRYAASA